MDNNHSVQNLGKENVAQYLGPGPKGFAVTIFGKEVIPLDVHFVTKSSTETEDEIIPYGLSEREKETFFRTAIALRPRSLSTKFRIKHGIKRSLPTVEPLFVRRVFEKGTLITITMQDVMREDTMVQVRGRKLIVSGLVREPANSYGVDASITPADPERTGNPRFLYNYITGVTEMMDLTSIFAGHRKGCVDLFLRRVDPQPENRQAKARMEEA